MSATLPEVQPYDSTKQLLYTCSHVLMVEPHQFHFNDQTANTNAFMKRTGLSNSEITRIALRQHQELRSLLVANGVYVTLCHSEENTPDAPFCNNWFSTHPAMKGLKDARGMMEEDLPPTVILYPLMAGNRRLERQNHLIDNLFRRLYTRVINMTHHEENGKYLESTGSLCMHDANRCVYAAISSRTNRELAEAWAEKMGYKLIAFTATDDNGLPYYHTNVMMWIGHGFAGVCLESIEDSYEREYVTSCLRESGLKIIELKRDQISQFAGNAISLANKNQERLLVMSTRAWEAYTSKQQAALGARCKIIHTDLSVFEDIGGGSARCLIGEIF